jgi:glutathionyl-hydroquinone reductase
MGRLVDGKWTTAPQPVDDSGRFARTTTSFRDRITADGSSGFPAEAGRYHLYVAWACPWAHRTLICRALKGLEEAIGISVVDPFMGDDGWWFSDAPGCIPDTVNGKRYLRDIYTLARPDYTGSVTVPILWDKTTRTIVNNESREVLRMLDVEMDAIGDATVNLCPADLRGEIDALIDDIYQPVNNGVYRAGFAQNQEAYEEAVDALFPALDRWNARLDKQRFLFGDRLTEADICLFTTLYRFDAVYYVHFKCNVRRIVDYPALWGYVRDIYQTPGVASTCKLDHIKQHYYRSHGDLNPRRVVPRGPDIDFTTPHGRERLGR